MKTIRSPEFYRTLNVVDLRTRTAERGERSSEVPKAAIKRENHKLAEFNLQAFDWIRFLLTLIYFIKFGLSGSLADSSATS